MMKQRYNLKQQEHLININGLYGTKITYLLTYLCFIDTIKLLCKLSVNGNLQVIRYKKTKI